MTMYRVSVVKLWRSTEENEMNRIITQFIKTRGENYAHDEFLNYLENRYRYTAPGCQFADCQIPVKKTNIDINRLPRQ